MSYVRNITPRKWPGSLGGGGCLSKSLSARWMPLLVAKSSWVTNVVRPWDDDCFLEGRGISTLNKATAGSNSSAQCLPFSNLTFWGKFEKVIRFQLQGPWQKWITWTCSRQRHNSDGIDFTFWLILTEIEWCNWPGSFSSLSYFWHNYDILLDWGWESDVGDTMLQLFPSPLCRQFQLLFVRLRGLAYGLRLQIIILFNAFICPFNIYMKSLGKVIPSTVSSILNRLIISNCTSQSQVVWTMLSRS